MSVERNRDVVRRYFESYHHGRDREILAEIVPDELWEPVEAATGCLLAAFPDWTGTTTLRVVDGRLARRSAPTGTIGILQQLGAVETRTARPGA